MSQRTTDLGPRISATTRDVYPDSRAVVDFTQASLLVRGTTSQATAGVEGAFRDGDLFIAGLSASTCQLAFRSGNTIYLFDSRNTAITI